MTDLELIQLLQQKSAGELTPTELEAIRARWTQSPDLRQALVEHLHLESQLTGALGPVQLDVDMILQRATDQRRKERVAIPRWSWLLGLCLFLAIGVGIYAFLSVENTPAKVGQNEPINPAATEVVPDDGLQLGNQHEVSADAALVNAVGEVPVEPTEVAPAGNVPEAIPLPAVVEIAANEPWTKGLARDVVPWGANSPKLTTDFKASGHDECTELDAKRWFAPVEAQPYNWSTDSIGNPVRRIAKFQGLAKLRAPWPSDAVLRMTPVDVTDLTLYFWRGPTGIALRYYTRREPHVWAAFEITRENSSPKPTRLGLLTTDSGKYFRSSPATLDIRHQDGDLVIARGGIVLLSVPFGGTPLEVFVEGQFKLRGISMFRSASFPSLPQNSHSVVMSGPAAKLPWSVSVESPASITMEADGSASMIFDSRDKSGIVALPFGWLLATKQSPQATGLFEVIVNVDSADPGTGLFVGDRDGRPMQQVAFFRDAPTQQITFGVLRPGETRTETNHNPNDFPPTYAAKSCWLKLITGLGTMHIYSSADGRHWGHGAESLVRDSTGAVGSMGLFGLPGQNARTIRVREIQIRELTGITRLADPALRSRVVPFKNDDWKDIPTWNHRVLDTQPADVSTYDWFTASAITALSQAPPKEIGLSILRQLVAAGVRSALTFDQKVQLINDATSLCDLYEDDAAKYFGQCYEELGWQLAGSGDFRPLDKIRPAWLWSPIWTRSRMGYVWERLQSFEILDAVYRRDWTAAWTIAQSASYWNSLPHPDQRLPDRSEDIDRHARWAKALVAEASPQLDDGTGSVLPVGLRHPLIPVLNKEAYNVRAELQSALSGQNYEDACRIVMSIPVHDAVGLLPDPDDRQLYVSMSTAIANARKAHPGFARTMTDQFEPLGQIRIQAAMNRRDAASLQATTLQFMGTDAARAAHMFLGDLALSVGQFDSAEQHFRDAQVDAGLRWQDTLEPRLLLARALGGRLTPAELSTAETQIANRPIELNGTTISLTDFQSVIRDLAQRTKTSDTLAESPVQPVPAFPRSGYKLEPRAQFDGHPGNNPGRWEYRFGDPFGRQMTAVSDDQRIYASNRFQINAYSIGDGKQVWAQGLGSEQGETYALPFAVMRPCVVAGRLFVRRMTKAGAELACLKTDDGQVVWHQRPSHSVLTDPVIWNGRLFAMTLMKVDEELVQVEASWFDPTTGNVLTSRPLFRFRDANDRHFSGQLTVDDRIAVCTVAGTIASFDSRGEMRWLRRSVFMQKPVDELAEDVRLALPVILSGRVICTIPGVREVSCLDLDSGTVIWEKPVFNLRGLLSVTPSRVVVDTVAGLVALDTESGDVVWRRPIESRLEACTVDGRTLLITRRATSPNNRSKPVLCWLDLASGDELGQSLIDVAERDEFQLGPLFSAGGKWWSFVGQTWKDPRRELHEFVAIPSITPKPFIDETLRAWRPELLDAQLAEIQSVIPGWFPAANYRERLTLSTSDLRGETWTLVSKLDAQNSIRFTSQVHVAGGRKSTLRLRVGNQPGQKWKMSLRTSHRILHEIEIEDLGSNNGWRDVSVDLSPFAGQELTLQFIESAINNAAAEALLKRIDLFVE